MRNDFKDEEITLIERYDKKKRQNIVKKFPQVGGRLRLFHEDAAENKYQASGVSTEIIKYEDNVAVVKASAMVNGSVFSGIGMASKSRDALIYPAILELAETRAIARALRFAGYGVEYTGAEEMSHISGSRKGTDETDSEPDESVNRSAKEQSQKREDNGVSLKRQVWDYIVSTYKGEDKETLVQGIKVFVSNTLKKNEGKDENFVYRAILDQKEHFQRAFDKLIGLDEPDGEPRPNEPSVDKSQEYARAKDEVAKAKKLETSNNTDDLSRQRRLQADIFMKLPEGTNVAQFNRVIDHLVECNKDKTKLDIYEIIVDDIESLVELIEEFDAKDKEADQAPAEDPKEEPKVEPKKTSKPEYSDFRKKWVNLNWKQFNAFIIKNASEFKKDRAEYDAAVEKYDRLKVNNDAAGLCFPFIFGEPEKKEPELDTSRSILEDKEPKQSNGLTSLEQGSYITQLYASYPKMAAKVADKIGYDSSQPYQTDEMKDYFVKTFDSEVRAWETENQLPYEED